MHKVLGCTAALFLSTAAAFGAPAIFGSAYIGSSGAATLYSISSTNGAATVIGSGIGFTRLGALSYSPGGTLYGVGNNGPTEVLLTINTTTGVGSAVGATGLTSPFQDIAFRSDGTLFGYSTGNIYTINTTTGVATFVGATGGGFPDGNALAFNSSDTLYLSNNNGLFTINQTTGAETLLFAQDVSAFPGNNPRANGMKFDPASGTLYASVVTGGGEEANVNYLATINTTTGVVTNLGTTVSGLDAIAISGTALPTTPIPNTWLLTMAGIAGLALFQTRERWLHLLTRA